VRFIKNGPDVPDRLIQNHEDGKVVFFCGAGISYPAGLPGFGGLVEKLYDKLGETPFPDEQAALKEKRFDGVIDLLERRVNSRTLVRGYIAEILQPDYSRKGATDTHRALLSLAKNNDGNLRLVTCVFRRNPATIPRPNRPLFRRESGHRSEGNSAGVPSRFRPLFLGGSELIRTVPA